MRSQKKAETTTVKQKERTTMKLKLTKIIMSSLAFAGALVCLIAVIAAGTPATARAEYDARDGRVRSVSMLRGLYLWTVNGCASIHPLLPIAVMGGIPFNGGGT